MVSTGRRSHIPRYACYYIRLFMKSLLIFTKFYWLKNRYRASLSFCSLWNHYPFSLLYVRLFMNHYSFSLIFCSLWKHYSFSLRFPSLWNHYQFSLSFCSLWSHYQFSLSFCLCEITTFFQNIFLLYVITTYFHFVSLFVKSLLRKLSVSSKRTSIHLRFTSQSSDKPSVP